MPTKRLYDYQCIPSLANRILRTYDSQGGTSVFTIGVLTYSELYVDAEGLIHISSPNGALVTGEVVPDSKIKAFDLDGVSERRSFDTISW